ncbi:MAG: carbohydrate ABC transporter permease [Hyphomicrobiales bacterium]|nr:carbohydrate ABC transporter permease [Hyphomicrobiales bacterium]MCP5374385.1 carbohydrate ABC transporter permease [Hyphomicrobiales bacterium]
MRALAGRAAFAAAVAAILLWSLFPFHYALVTAFKTGSELFTVTYWPAHWHPDNFQAAFRDLPFGRNIANSAGVAALVVAASLALGVSAAYALGRVRFRGRGAVLAVVLAFSMFPQVAVLSGMFELIRALGIYNNPLGLALSYLLLTTPFTVWVLTTFMAALPAELEEAAAVDGAGPWRTLVDILVPPLAPAMVATGLLAFIVAWNEFLFALTFTLTDDQRTVPVAIALISGASAHELPWGVIMAASVTVTLPLIALVLVFQRRIVAGLTAGAVKG